LSFLRGVGRWAGRGRTLRSGPIALFLTAELAVAVTFGLAGLGEPVVFFDVGFGVILLNPANDVFGVNRYPVSEVSFRGQFGLDEADCTIQQEL
jgi:hypothetical protein